jgi:anti-anti-sigma factor
VALVDIHQEFDVAAVQAGDGTARVFVRGELDVATVPELVRVITEERGAGRHLLLDLAGLTFIASAGIQLLVLLMQDAEENGWTFGVTSRLPHPIQRALATCGLLGVLPLVER